jgi:hypothetical protein
MHTDKFKYSLASIAKEDWERIFGGSIQHSTVESLEKSTSSGRATMQDVQGKRQDHLCKCGRSYNPA